MKNIARLILLFIILLRCAPGFAQDHLYSQFFNSPLYLNPALTGQFKGDLRMNLIYRNQWTSVPGTFSYISASIDYNVPRFGGGVGLLVTRSSEGTAYLDKTNISALYSYSVGSEDFVLSFGLQAGVTNRTIDFSKLVFGDQIDPTLGIISGSSSAAGSFPFNNKFYFDSGVGTNLAIGDFNIGAAVQHINKPNESFTGTPVKLPIRTNAHISYRYDLNQFDNMDDDEKSYVIPSVVFYKQSNATSYSAGMQYKHKSVNVGIWYRSGNETGPSAVVVSLIFDLFINRDGGEKLRFGVSHDAAVSGLTYGNTSGSSEGSIGYETTLPGNGDRSQRFEGARRCYEFY
ncbi:PorP/SprF family type IX secretion system membrane protein [Mucilaginibacter sp.]|uniref:PorP/SprF family type IX secretion system membrane protein n=1 Tax=Mucilaginibacter sp. TaxID=1882438 RepID=UPI002BE56F2A|nr:PorP/SprF family type IX secretion system membrane protein [Mucilaginibacter sp.]HTI61449.1 PorP/SprF family type IX secretion system membrane protein [Mucilaginibacter sp.]